MRILVASGSSGGHIFPACAFLETLRERQPDAESLLVLPRRVAGNDLVPEDQKIKYISTTTIKLGFNFKCLSSLFNFLKGSIDSLFIILRFKPDIVVGFGTSDCVPLVMFAWLFRIETLIHEQNVIPGRANRLMAKFADRVAVSFIQTKDYLKVPSKKIVVTGNPLRRELKKIDHAQALRFFGFAPGKFTVLVMGGSQGSHRINMAMPQALGSVSKKDSLQVIHICGDKDADFLNSRYNEIGIKARLFAFLREMQYAYSASDLVVCRAGATTIAELLYFKLPSIIIPYPFAYQHQLSNARALESMGSVLVINEEELERGAIARALINLVDNPDRMKEMHPVYDNAHNFTANVLFADAVLSLGKL